MEKNGKRKKFLNKKIRQICSYLVNDEFEDNVLNSSADQISAVLTSFRSQISSLTWNDEPINYNFAYCILQSKIAKHCDVCQHNLVMENIKINDVKVLTSYYMNFPKIIHCLECNTHQKKPHECIWCVSMLCNQCCPYYNLPN